MKMTMDQKNSNKNQRPHTLGGIPFAWQDMRIMKVIREAYQGEKLTTAIAVYQALTDLASNEGRHQRKHVSIFPAYILTIAKKSGKSESTIKRYTKDFRELGILSWEKRRRGKEYLASMWKLHDYGNPPSEPTSLHNNGLHSRGHNNEPVTEEHVINTINKKGRFNNFKSNDGFQSTKDILKGYGGNK